MDTDYLEIQNPSTPPQNPIISQDEEPLQPNPPHPSPPKPPIEETPESSRTSTLEIPNRQESNPKPVDQVEEDQNHDDFEVLSPVSQTTSDCHVSAAFGVTYTRRAPKGKPSKKRAMVEKKSLKKLEVLKQTLKPIPFLPVKKTLNFSRHESLLKRLGLWEFMHVEFDTNIRADLIAQLIATYSPINRCSYVKGVRINVSRADLARALNLPLKKDKGNVSVNVSDGSAEAKELQESIAFVRENVSNWMLLHNEMSILPEEVMKMVSLINEGSFEKVDWPSLIWLMMEKELTAVPAVGDCYYASHMQCLIKGQKNELLLSEEVKEVGEDGDGDVKMLDRFDDVKETEVEEYKVQLNLGQDNVIDLKSNVEKNLHESAEREDKQFVGEGDVEGNKREQLLVFDDNTCSFKGSKREEEENGQWFSDEKTNMPENQNLLRRCTVESVEGMSVEEGEENNGMNCDQEEKKQEVEERVEEGGEQEEEEAMDEQQLEGGFSPSAIGDTVEMVTSANLIQGMEAKQVPTFTSEVQIFDDDLPGEFLSSKVGTHTIAGGPSHFGNGNRIEILNDNLSHQSLNGSNKRMRSVGSWDNKSSSEFHMYMEQMEHLMAGARMLYESKEQACEESNVNQQLFLNEVQRRDSIIEHLHKAKCEVEQKRQEEVFRLERELFLMGRVLEGYRKALNETRREFAEYREHCPPPDEPLYKDVPGGEGLVLSVMELEKLRLKQKIEEIRNRLLIDHKLKDIEEGWIAKFEAHEDRVQQMCNRLFDLDKEVKPLKELLAKRKVSEMSECAPKVSSDQ